MAAVIDNPTVAMYVTAGIALIVVIGFFWFLWALDHKVATLRRQLDQYPAPLTETTVPLQPRRRVEQEYPDGDPGTRT